MIENIPEHAEYLKFMEKVPKFYKLFISYEIIYW